MRNVAASVGIVLGVLIGAGLPSAHAQFYSGSNTNSTGTTYGARPIGTATSESPVYYGTPGLSPAPGVSSSTGIGLTPGQFFYYNSPGIGYYRTNPLTSQFPSYPAPIALGGGYYQLGGLTNRLGYWRAPSGYYYPWCPPVYMPSVVYSTAAPIYSYQQGLLAPAQPSVGAILADMRNFLEDAKAKKQLDQSNYENLFRRVNELTAQTAETSVRNGGGLTVDQEREVRRQLDLLSADIARALTP